MPSRRRRPSPRSSPRRDRRPARRLRAVAVLERRLSRRRGAHRLRAGRLRLQQVLLLLHRPLSSRAASAAARWPTSTRRCEHLVDGGVQEVTLLGQSVEAYGRDLPEQPEPRRPHARPARHRRPGAHPLPHLLPDGRDGQHRRCRRRSAEGLRVLQPAPPVGRRRRAGAHATRLHGRGVPRRRRAHPAARSPASRSRPTSSSASAARATPSSSAPTTSWNASDSTKSTSPPTRRDRAPSPRGQMADDVPSGGEARRACRPSRRYRSGSPARSTPGSSARSRRCWSRRARRVGGAAARAATSWCTSAATVGSGELVRVRIEHDEPLVTPGQGNCEG